VACDETCHLLHSGINKRRFTKDVTASLLFFAPVPAITPLAAFIAASRFSAPPVLVGSMITGAYFGFIANLFLSRIISRIDMRQSIVVLMLLSAFVLVITGFQRTAIPFCIAVLCYLACYGIAGVQYNSLIKYLYDDSVRVKRLSYRHAALAAGGTIVSVLFGRLSLQSFQLTFTATALAAVAAAGVFRTIRLGEDARMTPFNLREILDVFRESRDLKLVAIGLGVYGIVGSAMHIPLTYLYTALGLAEYGVGLITATRVASIVLASLFITPRFRFPGGLANFRVVFAGAAVAVLCFLAAGRLIDRPAGIVATVFGNIAFAVSVSFFEVGIKTTALQLAPEGKSTIYVNALMIVFGIRGVLWPIVVGSVMQFVSFEIMFCCCLAASIFCLILTNRRVIQRLR
jgi:hypothetical protein